MTTSEQGNLIFKGHLAESSTQPVENPAECHFRNDSQSGLSSKFDGNEPSQGLSLNRQHFQMECRGHRLREWLAKNRTKNLPLKRGSSGAISRRDGTIGRTVMSIIKDIARLQHNWMNLRNLSSLFILIGSLGRACHNWYLLVILPLARSKSEQSEDHLRMILNVCWTREPM